MSPSGRRFGRSARLMPRQVGARDWREGARRSTLGGVRTLIAPAIGGGFAAPRAVCGRVFGRQLLRVAVWLVRSLTASSDWLPGSAVRPPGAARSRRRAP